MPHNLLNDLRPGIETAELMTVLYNRIGQPGQYDDRLANPHKFFLPLAGSSCEIELTYSSKSKRVIAIEPGPAFNASCWDKVTKDLNEYNPKKLGREFSFTSFPVNGWWRGDLSGIQILPPPSDAPRPLVEIAQHPFILEFPIKESVSWPLTNFRRIREHRKLTLLLNILLNGQTGFLSTRSNHFWAVSPDKLGVSESQWVQEFYTGKNDNPVNDELTSQSGDQLQEIAPEDYYAQVGLDGKGLRIPTDLDESIMLYFQLSPENRFKFDTSTYWVYNAYKQWTFSISSSFASLVSAVESLTSRGTRHETFCNVCNREVSHEFPGAIEKFRNFFENYAFRKIRNEEISQRRGQLSKMYGLRSGILHGSTLMEVDQERALGWEPPHLNERELLEDLWRVTKIALRNWLKDPPQT